MNEPDTVQLFFGLPLSNILASKIKDLEPAFLSVFIREGDHYLQEITANGVSYLGKMIFQPRVSLEDLCLLEANIYSLLNKLLNDSSLNKTPLVLLAIPISRV